jgi:hypothetical protein
MRYKFLTILSVVFLTLLFTNTVSAQNYGFGVKAGTPGFGADIMRSFGSKFNLRLGAAYFSIAPDGGGGEDDYEYTADVKLFSIMLLGDYFPFNNAIRITFGGIVNLNKGDVDLVPTESYTVGGDTYTPEELGVLSASIDFNRIAPYIGLGLGNPMKGRRHLQFTFDAGTMYQGGARVDLSATGLLGPSAAHDQEQQLEDNLSWFKWYPVMSFGIVYKF